jgi:hypothetical protein
VRARWPCMSSLVDVGRADIPRGAVGTAWRVQLLRDRGPPGTSRSRMTGRVSSSEDAARTTSRCSRSSRGVSLQCAYRAPRLGISTQGPVRVTLRTDPAGGLDSVHSRYAVILTPFHAGLTPGEPPRKTSSLELWLPRAVLTPAIPSCRGHRHIKTTCRKSKQKSTCLGRCLSLGVPLPRVAAFRHPRVPRGSHGSAALLWRHPQGALGCLGLGRWEGRSAHRGSP